MTTDEPDNGGEYNRVYGVKFKQQKCDTHRFNDNSITDDRLYIFLVVVGIVPFVGLFTSLFGMCVGYAYRHVNQFRIDEHVWRSGVIGLTAQLVTLLVLCIYLL